MSADPFANTRMVMVETTHPGNIGAGARAMATMGFNDLRLVNPHYFPHPKATEMAVGAYPILERAIVSDQFAEAVRDCVMVFGLTARVRDHMPPVQSLRQAAQEWAQVAKNAPCAFVFGQERSGLENEVLWQCHRLVTIPVGADYSSLNIASAMQLVGYEARMAAQADAVDDKFIRDIEMASHQDLVHLVAHCERLMEKIRFYRSDMPHPLHAKLSTMLFRLPFQRQDVRLWRGFFKEIEIALDRPILPKKIE